MIFPPSVPKPVYGATRFFRCFEPVRKGYCTADARLMFFGNGRLYSKLTRANVFEKGGCTLSFCGGNWFLWCLIKYLEGNQIFAFIKSGSMLIECFELSQNFAFIPNFVLSKKTTHSHNPIASLSMSVITYCQQKNSLRIYTRPHIRLCYAWSSQRFKSLPSISCKTAAST